MLRRAGRRDGYRCRQRLVQDWGRRLPKRKGGIRAWRNRVGDDGPANRQHGLQLLGLRVLPEQTFRGPLRCRGKTGINVGPLLMTERQQLGALVLAGRLQGSPTIFKRSLHHTTKLQVTVISLCRACRLSLCSVLLYLTYIIDPSPAGSRLDSPHYWHSLDARRCLPARGFGSQSYSEDPWGSSDGPARTTEPCSVWSGTLKRLSFMLLTPKMRAVAEQALLSCC